MSPGEGGADDAQAPFRIYRYRIDLLSAPAVAPVFERFFRFIAYGYVRSTVAASLMELRAEALFEKIVAMAMFSRRTLQNAIDGSLPYADRSKRRERVKILNSPTSVKYIPTEWDLVILQSLATLGTVQHESDLGGETKPDLHFQSPAVTFVADIATISDRGSHERNPIGPFEKELRKR